MVKSSFNLINASAGSGKTHSLVFNYLQELLSNSNDDHFRSLLALTFTNKAVNEMKTRIVETLSDFIKKNHSEMRCEISKKINIEESELRKKSERVLKNILYDYAGFDILTLDTFTHRIVRTFALDLKLPKSFEVVVEQDEILKELIQIIIDKVGIEKEITKSLVDFVHYKIDNENKESINDGLLQVARLILNENDRGFLKKLRNNSLQDFRKTQKILNKIKFKESENAKLVAIKILDKIGSNGLDESIFSRGSVTKHFSLIVENKFEGIYLNNLEKNLSEGIRIVKKTDNPKELIMIANNMIPEIHQSYLKAKKSILTYNLIQELNKQWTPLSLMAEMEKILNRYQIEEKKMLIGQFNEKISEVVQDFDAPFIYERIGEKYKHFFIDEFQDTSKLQWSNLKPLLKHALDTEDINGKSGSVFLVGDPKQAIYRWRGGDVQMFLELFRTKKFNQTHINTNSLPTNYRSLDNIIEFNNTFIKGAIESIADLNYRSFYKESFYQKNNNSPGGKTEIHFTENKMDSVHIQKTIDALLEAKKDGFPWGSMAILVRKKKQAISVFELISNTEIPIVSSESLLLKKSSSIKLILSVLRLSLQPDNSIERINICKFFIEKNSQNEKSHEIFKESLKGSLADFTTFLDIKFGFSFDTKTIQNSNLYELTETLISSLGLLNNFDTYLEFFLDYCYDFSIQSKSNIYNFLKKWEKDSEKLTIPMPDDNQAVRIMTIHVAKGLEFPLVILPFFYSDFQPDSRIKRQTWYPIKFNESKIDFGRINFSSRLETYGVEGKNISDNDKTENELDAFNTLYVALTRASHKIVVITTLFKKPKSKKNYAQLLIDFVLNQDSKPNLNTPFIYGSKECQHDRITYNDLKNQALRPKINFNWKKLLKNDTDSKLNGKWLKGNIIHKLLSKVKFESDINVAIESSVQEGIFNIEEKYTYSELLKKVINHKELNYLFRQGNIVYTEKEILLPKIGTIRLDRIVITKTTCVVIDYKTGDSKQEDKIQIINYSKHLESILNLPIEAFLVYVKDDIEVKKITNNKKYIKP